MARRSDDPARQARHEPEDLSFAAYAGARERFFATLEADSQIRRLEALLREPAYDRVVARPPGGSV
jgi:hypothetical protein